MPDSLISLQNDISRLIVDSLGLEDINPSDIDRKASLFDGGLGLDSIDALEIGAAISKHWDLNLKSQSEDAKHHFNSIESLSLFVMDATEKREA